MNRKERLREGQREEKREMESKTDKVRQKDEEK